MECVYNSLKNYECSFIRKGRRTLGRLFLTPHHLIFTNDLQIDQNKLDDVDAESVVVNSQALRNSDAKCTCWIGLPTIFHVERCTTQTSQYKQILRIRCRDFLAIALELKSEEIALQVLEYIQNSSFLPVAKLFAFDYRLNEKESMEDYWNKFSIEKDFKRMGISKSVEGWRFTAINKNYKLCENYPSVLVVPEGLSDNALLYASKFRSHGRIPVLTYIHWKNKCSITRSSQPLVGLKQQRSLQDEKLVEYSFMANKGARDFDGSNFIYDARSQSNALALAATGGGTENLEFYKNAQRVFFNLDNIHGVRDSFNSLWDIMKDLDIMEMNYTNDVLSKTFSWNKQISNVLDSTDVIVKAIHIDNANVLVHCTDGWDRTPLLCALAQICLDPHYRTIKGFISLIEKDWLAFGHQMSKRAGYGFSCNRIQYDFPYSEQSRWSAISNVSYIGQNNSKSQTCPVFFLFLNCVYQLLEFNTKAFQYNERFLRRIYYHSISCQFGTFLYDSQREREHANLQERTNSAWVYFLSRQEEWQEKSYDSNSEKVIYPKVKEIKFWKRCFG